MPGLPAVPIDEGCALSDRIESVEPMPEARSSRIAHFFFSATRISIPAGGFNSASGVEEDARRFC